jgi:hypothetical protein
MDAIDPTRFKESPVLRKLGDFESLTGRLDAGGPSHDVYELESKAGDQVRLRLTSDGFQVVGFVWLTASEGQPFLQSVAGGDARTAGSVETQVPVTLPKDGVYRIVVTSLENHAQAKAVSSGEYRMTLLCDTSSVSSQAPLSGPESQKGPRFSAWESDQR